MSTERFLVTGALGCIGAWVVRNLARAGAEPVVFDLASDPRRLKLIMTPDELAKVTFVAGDITDLAALERALDEHEISNIIHLAALQVPFCKADPPLGARVNVVGTVNVFEAAKRFELAPITYASSIAALDRDGGVVGQPSTLYGAFKRANEHTARVYFEENGISSVGLPPPTV